MTDHSPRVSHPGERLRALVTAVVAGDTDLARELAKGDICPSCLALEAAQWFVHTFARVSGLEGEDLAAHWSALLMDEAAGE